MRARGVVLGVLLAGVAGCDDPLGAGEPGVLTVLVHRGAPSAESVRIDSVAILIERTDSAGGVAAEGGAPLPPGTDTAGFRLTVPLTDEVETLRLTVRLMATGTEVFRTSLDVSARRGVVAAVSDIVPATWQVGAASGPGARYLGAMVAMAGDTVVLFGGLSGGGNRSDTWRLVGGTWTEITGPAPPGRDGHDMAYDAARGRIVLFAGRVIGVAPFGDTWTFDGGQWTEEQPADAPPARADHAMAFDARRGEVVLFGGASVGGVRGDTWVWNGTTWRLAGNNEGPPARSGHSLVWDPSRQQVVLFGGSNPDGARNDLWGWTGQRWERIEVQGAPDARREHAAGWDAERQRLVIAGGQRAGFARGDVWELAGDRWMPVVHAVRPSARYGAMMVSRATGGVALFGGRDVDGFLAELWAYR